MDEVQFLEELKKDFFEEANSMIESLEKNILIVENDPSSKEAINEIFRSAHTLKGGSATLDFDRIVTITHEMENLLDEIRSENMTLNSEIIDLLLKAIDVVKILIHSNEEGLDAPYGIENEVVANIKKIHKENKKQTTQIPKPQITEKYKTEETIREGIKLNDHEKYLIRMSSEAGYFVYKISMKNLYNNSIDDVNGLYTKLKNISTILQTSPPIDDNMGELENYNELELLIQTNLTEKEIYKEIPKHILDDFSIHKLSAQDIDDITEVVYQNKGLLLNDYDIKKIEREILDNKKAYKIITFFNADNPMRSVSGLLFYNMLENCASILKASPSHKELKEPNIFYTKAEFIISSSLNIKELQKKLHISDVTRKIHFQEFRLDIEKEPEKTPEEKEKHIYQREEEEEIREIAEELLEDGIFEREFVSETEELSIPDSIKRKQLYNVLRVDSSRIDQMLNFVGELVIIKASFLQINEETFNIFSYFIDLLNTNKTIIKELHRNLEELFEYSSGGLDKLLPDNLLKDTNYNINPQLIAHTNKDNGDELFDYDETVKNIKSKIDTLTRHFDKAMHPFRTTYDKLKSACQSMERVTDDLQEGVMSIRMIPINQIFNRFPRLVRDISRALNKEIGLVMEGEDTELDKSVIEDLLDPLIHIVRNSVDHGIELPEERQQKGKQIKGTILLKAEHEGNTISITVRDDGRGLSIDKIRRKAIEQKIIDPNAELSKNDIIELIFRPGFSTASKVSSISGRGVGMDVVRQRIENLSGSVEIDTKEGQWTSFTLKIPLTLAIIQALLIKVADYIYSIPINSVIETIQISYENIQILENTEIIRIRDDVISLVHLANLFNHRRSVKKEGFLYIVIVGSRGKKVGLAVDSLIGEQDVVIKPLSNKYTSVPGIAGATILGDGQVSLVIDVVGLFSLIATQDKSLSSVE